MNSTPGDSPLDYLKSAKQSLKWSTLTEVIARGSTPIFYLLLATILDSTDFGVIAICFALISFVQIIWDAGLGRSLIQTESRATDVANPIFWLNIGLAWGIYLLLAVCSKPIALFLNVPAAADVLPVFSFLIVLQAGCSVQQALLARDFQFKSILVAKLSATFIPVIIAVFLALFGFGVWSLVIGYLVGAVVNLIVYWRMCPWRPSFHVQWMDLRYVGWFGAWVFVEGIAAWFFSWGDNLFVGKFFGAEFLGMYTVGWNLVAMTFGLFINPLMPVFYSMYSRIKNNEQVLAAIYQRITGVLAFISLPLGVAFFVFSEYFIPMTLSENWNSILLVIQVIGLLYGAFGLISLNAELYRAVGRPDLNAKIMILLVAVYALTYVVVAPLGFENFLYARLLLGLSTIPVHLMIIKYLLKFDWKTFLMEYAWVLLGLVEIFLLAYLLRDSLGSLQAWMKGIIIGTICVVVYLGNAWICRKQFLTGFVRNLREVL